MRESLIGFTVLILHFICFFVMIYHIQALHAAAVRSDDANFEVLREILFSTAQSVTHVAVTAVAVSRFLCSRASSFRIMHIVFVTVSSCHVWFQGDCLEVLARSKVRHQLADAVRSSCGQTRTRHFVGHCVFGQPTCSTLHRQAIQKLRASEFWRSLWRELLFSCPSV